MGVSENRFIKSIETLQKNITNRSMESFQFRSVVSGLNQQLTYGLNQIPTYGNNFIRREDGRTYFIVGFDKIGNNAVVKS